MKIAGLGKCLPERVVTSTEIEERLGLAPGWIEKSTGIAERRHVTDERASQLGAQAALRALDDAGAALPDVDVIICASATMEQAIPCTAVLIQRELGPKAHGIPGFDVNSTCLSFVTGLDVAANALSCDGFQNALVVSADVASVGIDWSERESCVLLGDGAAAAFLTKAREDEASMMFRASYRTLSEGAELATFVGAGTAHHPNALDTVPSMNLFHMNGPRVFRFAQKHVVPFLRDYLAQLPFSTATLKALVAHQASLFALRAVARASGFQPSQVMENIRTHGNCVAASIPMVLHDSVREGRIARGDPILLAGTAAGVSFGALALVF